ncbi:uncharacterized protein LOC114531222 [Dendronephthya gigantea]|uniref:uncharacterized protein LOC114531222 n=1 Tax=Dendronephthya gigantea TaxID=151771 RepID=UPI00106B8A3B|nr:uncharacterized protein LOC114531222 [Dendronephthya gigantea]
MLSEERKKRQTKQLHDGKANYMLDDLPEMLVNAMMDKRVVERLQFLSKSMMPSVAQDILLIRHIIEEFAAIYEDELQDWLFFFTGRTFSLSSIRRCLQKMGWSRRKLNIYAVQRSDMKRAEYRRRIAQFQPHQFIFIDESSKDDRTFQRRYGRGLKGRRISVRGNFTRGKRYSVLCAISNLGVKAAHSILGSYDMEQFEFAMEHFVIPYVGSVARNEPCSVVVMDNCSIHNSNKTIETIRKKGGVVFFLPPYSPDMNPIEEAFGTAKTWLQRNDNICVKYPKRCFEIALAQITAKQCTGFFKDSGYF